MSPYAIFGITDIQYALKVQQHGALGGLYVEGNTVQYRGAASASAFAPGGIMVDDISHSCLLNNNRVSHVSLAGSNFQKPMPTLIRANGCTGTLDLYNNVVTGLVAAKSIREYLSKTAPATLTLCCNALSNSNTGLYITGPLNGAEIATTTFGNHPFAALHYDQVVSSGAPQINKGNDWSGASGTGMPD